MTTKQLEREQWERWQSRYPLHGLEDVLTETQWCGLLAAVRAVLRRTVELRSRPQAILQRAAR